MGFVYAGLWFVVGILLIFKMSRENKAFFAVGGFFLFWGVWQTLDEALEIDMYSGVYGWIHKGAALVALIICVLVVYADRNRAKKKASRGIKQNIEPDKLSEDTAGTAHSEEQHEE